GGFLRGGDDGHGCTRLLRRHYRRLHAADHAVGEVGDLLAQGAGDLAVHLRPVLRVGAVGPVLAVNHEVVGAAVDVKIAVGADDLELLVNAERRALGQAPDVFDDADGAVVETVHGPAQIGMLEVAHARGQGVGALDASAGHPQHQVGVVDAVAEQRADLFEHGFAAGGGDVAAGGGGGGAGGGTS